MTVTVSATAATESVWFTVKVCPVMTVTSSRTTVPNPPSSKVMV